MSHRDFQTTVLERGAESGGHVALVENAVPAGWEGPPLHHHDFDEALGPWPEVVAVGPRIGDRPDTASGVRP